MLLTKVTSAMKTRAQLDERSFEQLLAAAYLAQQRREPLPFPAQKQMPIRVRAGSAMDERERLAAIAEAHTIVHGNALTVQATLQLVAERALRITGGSGTAIWLLRGANAVCQTACGSASASAGQSIALVGSRLSSCLRDGVVFRCDDAHNDPRTRYDALPAMPQGSMVAVPIHYEGRVQGALEVSFSQARGFEEADVRTCQILSGLVSETVAVAAGQERESVLESERATLLEALDRLQPHLSKLLSESGAENPQQAPAASVPAYPEGPTPSVARLGKYLMAQQNQIAAAAGQGSRVEAQMRDAHTAMNLSVAPNRLSAKPDSWIDAADPDAHDSDSHDSDSGYGNSDYDDTAATADHLRGEGTAVQPHQFEEPQFRTYEAERIEPETGLALHAEPLHVEPWMEAAPQTPAAPATGFFQAHWADVCLATSALILVASLTWALWPRPAQSVAANNPAAAVSTEQKLSPFEQLLVDTGLAEAPPAPAVYLGTPGTKVWVDLHSALYYCPGAEPYGTTPKGKFLTQHDAQAEQFQPARGQPCE